MRSLVLVLAFATSIATGQPVNSAKIESESLLSVALPFAEKMLALHGEFFPYGEALTPDGKTVAIGATDGGDPPPSKDLIQLLKQGFKAGAKAGKYKATALVYDVRIMLPSTGLKSDAIAVSINHKDNYSALVFFSYKIEGKRIVLGEVVAQKEENYVFSD